MLASPPLSPQSSRVKVDHRAGDAFLRAAREGNMEALKSYVAEDRPVNYAARNGWTALHEAAFAGQHRVVKWLLRQTSGGAAIDIHARNKVRNPPCAGRREGVAADCAVRLPGGCGHRVAGRRSTLPRIWAGWRSCRPW